MNFRCVKCDLIILLTLPVAVPQAAYPRTTIEEKMLCRVVPFFYRLDAGVLKEAHNRFEYFILNFVSISILS